MGWPTYVPEPERVERTTEGPVMLVAECRQQPRSAPHRETLCRLFLSVGGVAGPATVRNVSASGIGLVLQRPFECGTAVSVELINASKNFSQRLRLRVVHARMQDDGQWLVGFAFAEPLNSEELQALL